MTDIKIREAAAIAAALMLARFAQLRFERGMDRAMPLFGSYLHAGAARLLLVPTVDAVRHDLVTDAMAAHGCDALVVRAAGRAAADICFEVGLLGAQPFWSAPMRLWLSAGAAAHFMPENPGDTDFALLRVGLRGCEVPPWDDDADREAGLLLGRRELARVLEGY